MQDRNRQDEKHVADRFIDERILRYVDENGRRVNKKSPNARGVREHSRKWYCKFRNADGMLCEIALFRDKSASQARLNDLRRAVERRQAGLADPYEQHRMRPLVDHLADFKAFLAAQENTADHVGQLVKRAGWVCKGCGFERIDDLDATKVVMWLSEQRKSRKRFSIQTSNFYQDAIKQFAAWLQRYDRIAKSPLMTLKRLNVKTDRRHDRRSISDDEFRRLVGAAANGPTVEGLAGENRAILYIVAAWTGLRRNELRSLTAPFV